MEFIILLEGGTSLARKPLPSHYLSLPATLCSLFAQVTQACFRVFPMPMSPFQWSKLYNFFLREERSSTVGLTHVLYPPQISCSS